MLNFVPVSLEILFISLVFFHTLWHIYLTTLSIILSHLPSVYNYQGQLKNLWLRPYRHPYLNSCLLPCLFPLESSPNNTYFGIWLLSILFTWSSHFSLLSWIIPRMENNSALSKTSVLVILVRPSDFHHSAKTTVVEDTQSTLTLWTYCPCFWAIQ